MNNNNENNSENNGRRVPKSRVEYITKWDKVHTTQRMLKFNLNTDKDILKHLDSIGNKQGYIKNLIRMDIARQAIVDAKGLNIPELHGSREAFDEMTYMRRAWIQTMCIEMKVDNHFIEQFLSEHTDTDELSDYRKTQVVDLMTKFLAREGESDYLKVFQALNRIGDWDIDAEWGWIDDDYDDDDEYDEYDEYDEDYDDDEDYNDNDED